tara:strand:+ start:393 stop:602 length:210 start_codon:yes stop_codon:yes gene_type:complete
MEVTSSNKGKSRRQQKCTDVEKITHEYFLKQNLFDPKKMSSPNLFMEKLEKRMKQYYDGLYKNFILSKK